LKRFFCNSCRHTFVVDHRRKEATFWIPHIDGISLRKLGDERGLSPTRTYVHVTEEFDVLPDNTQLTKEYCAGYSGILVVDGKFVKVRGSAHKIPFIFGIDYLSHDIPVAQLSVSESTEAFDRFFEKLKSVGYPLRIVVADDRSTLEVALKRWYPEATIQRCQCHYLENMRQGLHTRTDETHRHFFNSLKKHLFDEYENEEKLNEALRYIFQNHATEDPLRQAILLDIDKRRKELFAYKNIPECPSNTNLIELYNSHLNGRLKTIKGFKSFKAAERWLNAYILRRRTKSFTDCAGKFKHLNGKTSLQQVLKNQAAWPGILRKLLPKTER
jgi:transposase-like protein